MQKTDKEVLELCKSWFEDIMERSEKLTSGNVAHGRTAIRGVAKNYAEFIDEHLKNRWKPSDEQIEALIWQTSNTYQGSWQYKASKELLEQLKKLRDK